MDRNDLVTGSAPKGLTVFTFHNIERTDELDDAIKAAYLRMVTTERTLPQDDGAADSLQAQLGDRFSVSIRPVALTAAGRKAQYVAAFEVHSRA